MRHCLAMISQSSIWKKTIKLVFFFFKPTIQHIVTATYRNSSGLAHWLCGTPTCQTRQVRGNREIKSSSQKTNPMEVMQRIPEASYKVCTLILQHQQWHWVEKTHRISRQRIQVPVPTESLTSCTILGKCFYLTRLWLSTLKNYDDDNSNDDNNTYLAELRWWVSRVACV